MYRIMFMVVLTLYAFQFFLSTEVFLLAILSVWSLNLDLI